MARARLSLEGLSVGDAFEQCFFVSPDLVDSLIASRAIPRSLLHTTGGTEMEISTDVPLKPGNNAVTFFAREDEGFQARRTVYVYRRAAAQMAQGTQDAPVQQP